MKRRRRVAMALLTGAGLLGVAELVARALPAPRFVPTVSPGEIAMEGNPYLLWELRPGVHEEIGVTVTVNDQGFRGGPIGPKAGPRMLTLGDSSVYGFGVEDGEVWSVRTGTELGVEAINGAVPGWSSYQALNALELRGLALQPDVVMVGTLWSDNNFDGFTDRDLLASYHGWETSWTRDARVALETSALFRQLDWALRVAPRGAQARKVGWDLGNDEPRTGRRRVDIDAYANNLDTMARIVNANGGAVAFLMLANRDDLRGRMYAPAWEPYRAVMREAAARWGAPLVDVPALYATSGRSVDALFLDRMHPTALGHRLIGEEAARVLRAAGWPGQPLRQTPPAADPSDPTDPFEGSGAPQPATAGTPQPAPAATVATPARPSSPEPTADVRFVVTLPATGGAAAELTVLSAYDGAELARALFRRGVEPHARVPASVESLRLRLTHDADGDGVESSDPTVFLGPFTRTTNGLPITVDARAALSVMAASQP